MLQRRAIIVSLQKLSASFRVCLCVIAPLVLLVSCHREHKRVIAVIPKATSHLFFVSVHAGVRAAEHELGIDTLWNGPEQETDYSRQIQIVDAMVARRVDAIAISATDRDALVAPVRRAIAAGIPVSVFDSGLNIDNYVTFVATDNYGAGETAARTLAELLGGRGNIAIIMQRPGGQSTVEREKGFQDCLRKQYPAVHVVASQFGMGDPAKSRDAAENILTSHPDLDGIFASAEASSIGAIQAIKSRGVAGKIKLVGFDFSDSHRQALTQGVMSATVVQDTYRIGYEAVRSLVMALNHQTPPKRIDLPGRVVTAADLNNRDLEKLLRPVTDLR